MVRRGRFLSRIERKKAEDRMLQALDTHPEGLGIREWRKESGMGSFETFYKRLKELSWEKKVVFREENVGRGRRKKIYRLSQEGISHLVEFKILEYFEAVRKSCKENERFELDNYAFAYAIYGLPKHLSEGERIQMNIILGKVNSALLELDDLMNRVTNREAYRYREAKEKVYAKIIESVSEQNKDRKPVFIDSELLKELENCIPSSIKNKMRLREKEDFALVITRGPSFVDEYSLRPENHLLDLIQTVESWDDDGIDSVVRQLARNKCVDADSIERLKQWNVGGEKIMQSNWQKIKDRLDDIPKIREEMKEEKERFIQSGGSKRVLGLGDETSFVVTKKMLGKKKLNELRKEFSEFDAA